MKLKTYRRVYRKATLKWISWPGGSRSVANAGSRRKRMPFDRREAIHLLSFTVGSAIAGFDGQPAQGAEVPTGEIPMERVLGIGGFFFRAQDPAALAHW